MSISDIISISSDEESDEESTEDYSKKILDDRYIIIKKIGSGLFSSVWLGYHIKNKHENISHYRHPSW